MKKYIILFISLVAVIAGAIGLMIHFGGNSKVETFVLAEYQYYIDAFPWEETVGSITGSKDVKKKAEKIWFEIYGERISKKKPYQVYFDPGSEVWLVNGTLPYNDNGGVPYILIEAKTGKVLAVWHDK
ncbi:MAG: hypothetical protein KIC77_10115 [Clostridiales bacterium]|jgi:hypothetical protein|nr:hypothetical protein [Clostridiales bacterium]